MDHLGRKLPARRNFAREALVFLACGLLVACGSAGRAALPLHKDVLVFVPAYEASQLFDADPGDKNDPVCVWGCYNVFFSSKRYFALRLPNPLVAKPLLAVGPIDVYRKFVSTMTEARDDRPQFSPYTRGADFFIFTYDWRQEIATDSAPKLAAALENFARIHESKTGLPAAQTRFIIVAHSMGGLVVRTLLSEQPEWAARVSRLYLVGTPNAGSVKATRTVVVGPDSIEDYAHGFPGALLDILPTDVDQNVTKLVGITRPSLYELLPMDDPHWTAIQANGDGRRMSATDVLLARSWEPYWPSAGLEKRLFLDGWLKNRATESGKTIDPAPWEFCQDPAYGKLKEILGQVARWRNIMGRLSATDRQLTRAGESSRLKIVLSTGLKTPSGVLTVGLHDDAKGYYTYDAKADGDGTVERVRVLDDMKASSLAVEQLQGVPHGRLMIDPHFLAYFTKELAGLPMVQ
jgi:hypothetical protein